MRKVYTFILSLCALVAWSTSSSAEVEEFTKNLIVVIDASGSMDGTMADGRTQKMDAAKTALKSVLNALPADTHVGITCFGSCQTWVYKLGPRDEAALNQAIDAIRPGGGTPLGKFMKRGADRLLKSKEAQHGYGSYQLLVVTDGEADMGDDSDEYATDIVSRGIDFDVIGVAMSSAHSLKTKARIYRDAANPEELQRAATEILAEVTTVDETGVNPFELVNAAFGSDETVRGVLQALASSGNHPIGEKPRAPKKDGSKSSGSGLFNSGSGSSSSADSCQVSAVGSPHHGAWAFLALVLSLNAYVFFRHSRLRPAKVVIRTKPERKPR